MNIVNTGTFASKATLKRSKAFFFKFQSIHETFIYYFFRSLQAHKEYRWRVIIRIAWIFSWFWEKFDNSIVQSPKWKMLNPYPVVKGNSFRDWLLEEYFEHNMCDDIMCKRWEFRRQLIISSSMKGSFRADIF